MTLRIGALCWNQYTHWPALLEAGQRAIRPYLEIGPGYRHLLAGFPAPYDEESMTRFAAEVRPRLERALR